MAAANDDEDRIAKKAHEIWEAAGRPHGRDQEHWDEAKEIIALEDSPGAALKSSRQNAEAPVESKVLSVDNAGDMPVLTDTGEHDLTSIDREPAITKGKPVKPGKADVKASPAKANKPAPKPVATDKGKSKKS